MFTIRKGIGSGCDWHDYYTTGVQMVDPSSQSYSIKSKERALEIVANNLLEDLKVYKENYEGYLEDLYKNDFLEIGKFSLDDIMKIFKIAQAKGEYTSNLFDVVYRKDEQQNIAFIINFFAAQVEYNITYLIDYIKDDNAVYLVCEDFYCPWKGADTINRLVHEPFDDINKALEFKQYCFGFKDVSLYGSQISFSVADKEELKTSVWYKENMKALKKMIAKFGSLYIARNDDSFHISVSAHNEALDKINK